MNIGMVVDNELDGDVRVLNEARSLAEAGFAVFVLCLAKPGKPLKEERDGFAVVRLNKTRNWRNKAFFFAQVLPYFHCSWRKAISKFIQDYHIDVMHAHDLYMARSAGKAAQENHIPWIIDLHENFPEAVKGYRWAMKFPNRWVTRPDKWKAFERKYLPRANRIVVLSENFKKQLLQSYPHITEDKFVVYPNVPDVEALERYPVNPDILPEKGSSKVLFYFGGIAKRRGVYTLVDAHKKLTEKGYDVKLLLIGPADKAEKPRFLQAIESGVKAGSIIYYEWKEMSDLPSYIQASDICISPIVKNPQHDSGIANKVFQYMLFERPVVVSDSKPQREVVEENECGIAFESENADDLAEKAMTLLKNPAKAEEMGKRGREVVL
ncbi:MAG: glycosyltransferase family 4 protein, partial [Bacteroidota bacterium]